MKENYVDKLIGGRITSINRICDLVSICFSLSNANDIYMHIQSFFRVLKDNIIIITSDDMYRRGNDCKDNEEFRWDLPGQSLYDDSVNKYIGTLIGSIVANVRKEANGDLVLFCNNGLELQIFINTVEIEEKYRIFSDTDGIVVDSFGRYESDQ